MKKLLVVLLVLGLAAPAMAQTNFQFYGSLRTHLGYYHQSSSYTTAPAPAMDGTIEAWPTDLAFNPTLQGPTGYDLQDEGTVLGMSGQSRLGVRGFVSDKLFGVVEFGFRDTTRAGKTETVYTRMAFGQWNFGAGSLLFGKAYTPGTFLGYSNMTGDIGDQGDAIMLVGGLPYIGRQPQIKLMVAGFELALIEQYTPASLSGLDTTGDYGAVQRLMPRIEAAYEFKTPMITVRPVVGYQNYKLSNRDVPGDDMSVTSYLAGLGLRLNFGPAYINMTGSWLQNAGNYGNSSLIAPAGRTRSSIDDAETLQATFVAGFRFSPMFGLEAGVGYAENKVDILNADNNRVEQKQSGVVYYLQAPIVLAKGFTLIPEVGQVSRGDISNVNATITDIPVPFQDALGIDSDEADVTIRNLAQGRMTYFVVNLRIDF